MKAEGSDAATSMRVAVESSVAWRDWPGARAVLAELRAALEQALLAWQLPLKPVLRWHVDASADAPPDSLLRLSIGSERFEAAVRVPAPAAATAASVARALAWAAHGRPEAWVAPHVLTRLGVEKDQQANVQEGARRGFSPRRFVPDTASLAAPADFPTPSLGLAVSLADSKAVPDWRNSLETLAVSMFEELGAWLPAPTVAVDPLLTPGTVRLRINDLQLPPIDGLPGGDTEQQVADLLRRYAWALWSRVATDALIERQARMFERLVHEWQARFKTSVLHDVVVELLRERVGIRNVRGILEATLAPRAVATIETADRIVLAPLTGHVFVNETSANRAATQELSGGDLLEQVRAALAPWIMARQVNGAGQLAVYPLDPALEIQLRDAPASFLVPRERRRLIAALCGAFEEADPQEPKVLLATRATRALLRRLIRDDFPEVAVLSGAELGLEAVWQPLRSIAWPAPATSPPGP